MTVKVNSINILANNVKTFALDISFICYFVQYYILSTPLILGLASDHVFVFEAYGLWYCISHAIILQIYYSYLLRMLHFFFYNSKVWDINRETFRDTFWAITRTITRATIRNCFHRNICLFCSICLDCWSRSWCGVKSVGHSWSCWIGNSCRRNLMSAVAGNISTFVVAAKRYDINTFLRLCIELLSSPVHNEWDWARVWAEFILTRPHTVELLQRAEESQEHGLDLGGGHQQQSRDTNPPHAEAGLRLLCVWHEFINSNTHF